MKAPPSFQSFGGDCIGKPMFNFTIRMQLRVRILYKSRRLQPLAIVGYSAIAAIGKSTSLSSKVRTEKIMEPISLYIYKAYWKVRNADARTMAVGEPRRIAEGTFVSEATV